MIDLFALAFAKTLMGCMCWVPVRIGLLLAKGCIRLILLCMPRLHGVGRKNLLLAFPEKSPQERELILVESYNVLARNLLAFARIPRLTKQFMLESFDFTETHAILDRLHKAHRGVGILIVTAHFGSFELLGQYGALVDRGVAFLARGFGLPRLDAWWFKRRELFGNTLFYRRGGSREVLTRLRAGQDVTILCDQNVKSNHATFADFFGIPVATVKTPAIAALRTGAPVVFMVCVEDSPGRYQMICEELPNPESFPGTPDERIQAFSAEMNQAVERAVRRKPDHWFWIHRRFKTRPPGEAETIYSGD